MFFAKVFPEAVVQMCFVKKRLLEILQNSQEKTCARVSFLINEAFDTVDDSILLRKLELYGITDRNYAWIKSYLSNRLQHNQIDENSRTEFCVVKCGVPQGSILGPLLFLLYVNDLKNASSVLDPIMFADDTNLFYTHSNIPKLF